MASGAGKYVVCESPASGVHVARFTKPDLRAYLYGDPIEASDLYKDIDATVLPNLGKGEALVLNFGLVDRFPTAFYRLLLKLRQNVSSREVKMLLCGFSDAIMEGLNLLQAQKVFTICKGEEEAVYKAQLK